MDNMKHRRLQELDRSDFGIVEGEPDIRGWDVRNTSGQKIGEVEDLIIDAQQQKVRYMVVELDDDDLELEDDKKVLIPIGLAELDKEDDDVILSSVEITQLNALPAYDADYLNDDFESQIHSVLSQKSAADTFVEEETGSPKKRNALIIEDTGTPENIEERPTAATAEPPAIGTPEYYASFYQHPYFNDKNLGRNRKQPGYEQSSDAMSEYERGLRLWEIRNENRPGSADAVGTTDNRAESSADNREDRIRQRRTVYEERRKPKRGRSIIDRINEEGLQETRLDRDESGKPLL